jgi:hypothetical protein
MFLQVSTHFRLLIVRVYGDGDNEFRKKIMSGYCVRLLLVVQLKCTCALIVING